MDEKSLLKQCQPYLDVYKKETLKALLMEFPELLKDLHLALRSPENRLWISKAKREEIYFIAEDNRWKSEHVPHHRDIANIYLVLIGPEKVPVIEIIVS